MQLPQIIEVHGQRVLSTKQIAEAYGTTEEKVRWNFKYNRKRYIPGKHFIIIEGDELRKMKRECEFQTLFKQAKSVCFWTEKGALLHAKSLNTDKAWEVYDYLVDFYFRTKEQATMQQVAKPQGRMVVNVPDNLEILQAMQQVEDDMTCMRVLLNDCKKYISEEEYQKRSTSIESVMDTMRTDLAKMLMLKPQIVPVRY